MESFEVFFENTETHALYCDKSLWQAESKLEPLDFGLQSSTDEPTETVQ